jgi:hypothetical protein
MFVTIYFEWRGMRFGDNVGKFMYLVPDLEALHVSQTRPNKRNKQDAIIARQYSNNKTREIGGKGHTALEPKVTLRPFP